MFIIPFLIVLVLFLFLGALVGFRVAECLIYWLLAWVVFYAL